MPKKNVTIERIVVIAKLSDGTYHQILIKKDNEIDVLHTVATVSGGAVNLTEKEIYGIEFDN